MDTEVQSTLGPGDAAVLEKGSSVRWEVGEGGVRKLYVIAEGSGETR